MKHYYTNNSDLVSELNEFNYEYKGKTITFFSDNGVFSKQYIDYGSQVLLENIKIKNKARCLDVGCGYGTFGICLKKSMPCLKVDMVDVNDRAIDLAKKNADYNNVDVTIFESSIYENVVSKYDVIITNPPIRAGKDVVTEIMIKSIDFLTEQGEIWVIIQKKQGAPSVQKTLTNVFGNCEIIKRDKGYYLLKSIK